jgi:hypothetical protein
MNKDDDAGDDRVPLHVDLNTMHDADATAEAAPSVAMVTKDGGLAAIAIVERELDASFSSRGSDKPTAVEDIISNQEGTWARSWYDAREEVLKLGAVANASLTFCDEPAIRKRLEYADFICGLLLAVACDFSYGVSDATVRAANV